MSHTRCFYTLPENFYLKTDINILAFNSPQCDICSFYQGYRKDDIKKDLIISTFYISESSQKENISKSESNYRNSEVDANVFLWATSGYFYLTVMQMKTLH